MKTKVCNSCLDTKSVSDFHKAKLGKFGVRSFCKTCEKLKQSLRRSSLEKKTKISLYNKSYCKEKKARACKAWVDNNYDHILSYNASRRQLSKVATFPGYEKEIENFYWLARDLKAITGENYHVDHIVPLRGKTVCGLHVPWNLQVLPSDLNLSKGNTFGAMKQEIE